MGVNSLPKTVTRHRRYCDLNPGPSVLESSTLTTRLLGGSCQFSADSQPMLVGLIWGLAATRRSVCIHQMNGLNYRNDFGYYDSTINIVVVIINIGSSINIITTTDTRVWLKDGLGLGPSVGWVCLGSMTLWWVGSSDCVRWGVLARLCILCQED